MRKIASVCVYCASSSRVSPIYFEAAETLGRLLVQQNIRCIYGAGAQGLMGRLADTILAQGGKITGIIPQFMYDNGWCHTSLQDVIITPDIHRRKELMSKQSDAIIALPGGCGTLEELLEIITWKQLGLYKNPIILLNINGYYDPLTAMLDRAVDEHFIHPEHSVMWCTVATPEEAVQALYSAPEWSGNVSKLAVI